MSRFSGCADFLLLNAQGGAIVHRPCDARLVAAAFDTATTSVRARQITKPEVGLADLGAEIRLLPREKSDGDEDRVAIRCNGAP